MPEIVYPQDKGDSVRVNLGNPYMAALLAWLVPGLGHLYQRRFAKGLLFMVCILSTYFVGLGLGHGRVVYASNRPNDFRWQYAFQVGVGAVTFPAIIQTIKTKAGDDPLWVLCERFPDDYPTEGLRFQKIPDDFNGQRPEKPFKDGFMAPPAGKADPANMDTLGRWHFDYKHFYEMGTLYTMVAGLLNLLVIYDAFCGPAIITPDQRERIESKKRKQIHD